MDNREYRISILTSDFYTVSEQIFMQQKSLQKVGTRLLIFNQDCKKNKLYLYIPLFRSNTLCGGYKIYIEYFDLAPTKGTEKM